MDFTLTLILFDLKEDFDVFLVDLDKLFGLITVDKTSFTI